MKFRLEQFYCLYQSEGVQFPVLMYAINGYPYTFDTLPPENQLELDIIEEIANHKKIWTDEDLYHASVYLMLEDCHPCFNDLDLENPELLPKD